MSIHDDRHTSSSPSAHAAGHIGVDGIADLADDFDQMALLDACRNRDLATLLDLYADDARLECRCGEASESEGRAGLESYWRPRLEGLAPTAFGLQEITPTAAGVVLDYLSHDGEPVRIAFTFSRDARIHRTACLPVAQALRQDDDGVADQAG